MDEVYYTAEIFGNPRGTYAALNVAPAAIVARKPKNLAGGTAWDAMVRRLKVHLGETVLIHGDAGGVGSFAVQIGKPAVDKRFWRITGNCIQLRARLTRY